ncbi:MAG: ORF6N domain-containing protein [Patescibacteria group bacterium]
MRKKNTKSNKKQKKYELITVPSERVISKIFLIRGKKVMMDKDLAELYGVETKSLNRAVKRNMDRFPSDFMFRLNKEEAEIWKLQIEISDLRSQIVTSSLRYQIGTLKNRRGRHKKYLPYVFTEQGVAMLSSVLNSKRAIQVNIQTVKTTCHKRGKTKKSGRI